MKMPSKLIASILTGALALGLVGCGNANTNHKSASNKPKTTQEAKPNKSKKSNKKTLSKPNPQKQTNQKQNTQNKQNKQVKPNKAKLTNNEKKSLQSEPSSRPVVNLGNGIKGTEDRGAGQVYISFTANGHKVVVHGNDVQSNANALDKAKEVAAHKSSIQKNQQIQANGTR